MLILFSGIVSNITQGFFSNGVFGGMSGVIYALLGYLFLIGKLHPYYPARIADNIAYFLIGFMAIAALGFLGDGIGNAAHISGFIIGLFFATVKYYFFLKHRH